MKNKVILLTGVPCSGKTTIARLIKELKPQISTISFGEEIHNLLNTRKSIQYETIREKPTRIATKALINEVKVIVEKKVINLKELNNVLLDSHAVVADDYGFRIIPEFDKCGEIDVIILVNIDYSTFKFRCTVDAKGRKLLNEIDFNIMQQLQNSIVTAYSISSNCVVYVLNNHRNLSVEQLKQNINIIFDDIKL
jgi:adenylate kinase